MLKRQRFSTLSSSLSLPALLGPRSWDQKPRMIQTQTHSRGGVHLWTTVAVCPSQIDGPWQHCPTVLHSEQSDTGIISPVKWGIPQHWVLQRFSWTGSWTIWSRLYFCWEGLDQMTYEGPSILYSIILQSYENVKKI